MKKKVAYPTSDRWGHWDGQGDLKEIVLGILKLAWRVEFFITL